ncbi:MAG: Smr/MutS family protein [Saprospiraceae bacterium]|nr:Smr/MutS family protein [Saprospiraceae bacterium]
MIKKYPKDIFEKVEFDKVLLLVENALLGEKAIEYLYQEKFQTDIHLIQMKLDQVDQWSKATADGNAIPLENYESIESDIPLLKKDGYVLSVDAIRRIYKMIHLAKILIEFFDDHTRRKAYPLIFDIYNRVEIDPDLLKEIDRVLDDRGEVRPDASPELLKIHKAIRSKERELDNVFSQSLKRYGGEGMLADTNESLRNGRRVLTVSAEYKRRISGVIHDESATGKTVYIEPSEVMPINNAIFNLYTDRKKEVYKVLKDLCAQIRPYAEELMTIESVLIELDLIRAKSRVASTMDAEKPQLIDQPHFGYKKAYNPLLLLKNRAINKETIPFNLELHGANRMLVLSGPNAGGKSVTMKSVGLLQMMVQFGMLIPADPNSKIGIFKRIFTDIGDQQSLEDDLSTYSSRLQNMKYFLENANEDTLVLIDEFGSGTDPKIGGAIAEAILKQLNYQKVFGVITTHYSNLKYYAFKTKGVVNGAMEFNKAKLAPTYQLIIGKPGSSFAFEIAEKSGLSKRVLNYARHKTGKNEKAIDELLTNLQAEKKEVEDRMEILLNKEDKVDKMIRSYDELYKELEFRRKKLKLQQKEAKLVEISYENRELENAIREIKEAKNLEKAKKVAKKHRESRKLVQSEVEKLQDEVYYGDNATVDKELKEGSYVRMRSGGGTGQIVSLNKNKATIQMGFLNMEVPLGELLPSGAPIEYRSKSVNTEGVVRSSNFESKLDIRGYTKKDAEAYVQEFMDKAIINNAAQLKIVHGKGSGILKKVVLRIIREYNDVREYWHPEDEMGGDGVTYVEL